MAPKKNYLTSKWPIIQRSIIVAITLLVVELLYIVKFSSVCLIEKVWGKGTFLSYYFRKRRTDGRTDGRTLIVEKLRF